MKRSLTYTLLLGVVVLFSALTLSAQEVKVDRWVIGSGGMIEQKTSGGMTMSGIAGQLAIEKISGTVDGKKLDVYQGFWVPVGDFTPVDPGPAILSGELSNFPNPVSTSTTIRYQLPGSAYVTLKVFDVVGNIVKVLADNYQDAGPQEINWDTRDESGLAIGSGSYIYELNVRPAQMAGSESFKAFSQRNIMVIVR
jgi:hypothetical protein